MRVTHHLELRTATDDDLGPLVKLASNAFLKDAEEGYEEYIRPIWEPDRTHVMTDGERLVGTAGVLTRDMTVPGAVVPTAHVTAVSVASTHRRRGILRRLMAAQLADVRDRGEPIAALWASEGAIYGRFGYGLASWHAAYTISRLEMTVPGEPAGSLWQEEPRDVTSELAAVYERVRRDRPGLSDRPGPWWEHLTADPRWDRGGRSSLRAVLYRVDDRVDGYALWRVKGGWSDTGPNGEVTVVEVAADGAEAYAALWRFLLSIDLTRTVKFELGAVDEPLAQIVTNPSGLGLTVEPALWVRVVDVAGALESRRYAAPVDVVLEVTDAVIPDNTGRWHLAGNGSSAKCQPTGAAPDLSVDVRDLGAAYLGGTSLATLAAAGRVTEHRPGTLGAASVAFGWHRAPQSVEVF